METIAYVKNRVTDSTNGEKIIAVTSFLIGSLFSFKIVLLLVITLTVYSLYFK